MNSKPKKVLVIGSGPIVIGQAAEFDYAGTQACRALREEGVTTVLVNSNPATIMTDRNVADAVYIEPLTVEVVERIIAKERPDGLLPTLGGQTGLNLAVDLADAGVLDKYNVRLLGTPLNTIKKAEDRALFRALLRSINEPTPASEIVESLEAAEAAGRTLGLPLVVRPAYTLGGTGGGIATTMDELLGITRDGLAASPIHQVLVEQSLVGWRELEYEIIRDAADNCVVICNMENLDPMGVHTGDSIVTAPSQTLSDKEHQMLRSASIKIIRALDIQGGCNIQFGLSPNPVVGSVLPGGAPEPMQYYVIEVNPRVSRSSALASKATGYPIARVAAKIAVGKRLDEIPNAVTQKTTAAFEPTLDYCVVKIPRWPFDKFATADRRLGTQMKATGEVMAIDRTFEAALQKAVRSLEFSNRSLLWEDATWRESEGMEGIPLHATDLRLWGLMAALRKGMGVEELSRVTHVDPWFIYGLENILFMERRLLAETLTPDLLREAKLLGFSDVTIGTLADLLPEQVRAHRKGWDIHPVYKMVDTCAAEFEAATSYFYSCYDEENEATALPGAKALVIGSGPIRIGQGIEFDYCSVHAALSLHNAGIRSIMVNSNPETVSTDFDASDRLYFEPLDIESVLDILDNESDTPDNGHDYPPSVVQFGGQTAINLSQALDRAGMPVMGSSAEAIDTASDRERFNDLMERLGIPQPPGATVTTLEEALSVAQRLDFPLLVRPSYVLGGRAMEIVTNTTELVEYIGRATEISEGRSILIDQYLEGREVEVDAVSDGENILIPGILEHVERAGVHSGDSMAIYPDITLTTAEAETLVDYTARMAKGLGVKGLMNVQFVVMSDVLYRDPATFDESAPMTSSIYVIEVNPRASRTIPFISKVTDVPMVDIATRVMLGSSLTDLGYKPGLMPRRNLVGVKAPVFSMSKLAGVDTYLGPEMKSTGEVMGIDFELRPALAKALVASNLMLPTKGSILLTIADKDKAEAVPWIKQLHGLGYFFYATVGTAAMLRGLGIPVTQVNKIGEPEPNAQSIVADGMVEGVVNTIANAAASLRDGFEIRRTATERRVPCYTSLDTARVVVETLAYDGLDFNVLPNADYVDGKS